MEEEGEGGAFARPQKELHQPGPNPQHRLQCKRTTTLRYLCFDQGSIRVPNC